MDFKTFLENFDAIAEAPGGIPKLRSLILELAVRGKLASQNPEDEPAEKLLKVIFNKHIAFGKKFRKPNDLPPIENIDKPFELPYGWCWCRFTEIGQLERGRSKHRPRNEPALYNDGSIPLVQTGDVARANGLITTYTALYNEKGLAQSRLWSKGTLCITIAANIADSAILGFDACFPDSIVGFLPTEPISDSRYFEFFIRTLKSHLEDFAPSTAQKNINLAILDEVLIPLPPLAEQKRIVEKVDELMALCDRYEAARQTRDNLRQQLRGSAIASIMNAETDEELDAAWAFVCDNWQSLSQQPEDIDGLRKSVLQLAIRGELVPQHPNDEPASDLLKKLKAEKEQLLQEKRFLKSEKLAPIKLEDLSYKIPEEWALTRIGVVCGSIVPTRDKPKTFSGGFPWVTLSNFDEKSIKLRNNHSGIGLSKEEVVEFNTRIIPKRSVLMSCVGRFGLVAVLERDVVTNQQIHGFVIPNGLYPEYVAYVIKAHTEFLESSATSTTVAYLNKTRCESIPFPLPPLAEQKRIVAKVDELMQLCDQLEESLRQSQQRAESLAASAISHLTI